VRFFRQIRTGIDVAPLLSEIEGQEDAWLADTSRQNRNFVQRDTNTIFLRVAAKRRDIELRENQETRPTIVWQCFPRAAVFMASVAREFGARLERATIVRLKPHSVVSPHVDTGSYYFLRDRFHLVLSSPQGSVLASGDEQVRMWPGELWWFDNKQHHWAENEGDGWRIHYIFDLLPRGLQHLAVNPVAIPDHRAQAADSVPAARSSGPLPFPEGSSSARVQLREAISGSAILHGDQQMLVSHSGRKYTWMIDMRRVLTDARCLDAAAELFWDALGNEFPFQVGGIETAAIPLIAAIAMKSVARGTPVNSFIVRKERKTYGAGQLVEGILTDDSIVIVDDVLNSGQSLEKVRAVLDVYDRTIAHAFVLIDYRARRGLEWRERNEVPVLSPFDLGDFEIPADVTDKKAVISGEPIFRKVWSFTSERASFFHRVPKSFPATDGKRVYFGSDSGTFRALDAWTGKLEWEFHIRTAGDKNIWSAPAVHDGRIYFGAYDGNVYCLDSRSGEEIWRFTEADWVGSSPALAPALGLLFIGLEFATPGKQGSIAALELDTGRKVWEHQTRRYTHASPAYWADRQLVACGSNDDELFLFDAPTGHVRWRFQTRGDGRKGSIRHSPAFDTKRGTVIAGCADGFIYILDVDQGTEVWSVRTDNEVYTVPLCVGDLAFMGSTDKFLYVLDLEQRSLKTRIATQSKVYGPPRLLNGAIYFGACNGLIYKLDPATAAVAGTFQLPDAVTNALSYSPDTNLYYALTYVNELFALQSAANRSLEAVEPSSSQ